MAPFDPTQFGFVLLGDFQVAGQVPVYEFNNHRVVGGSKDFLRLNLYLTKDEDYVTIWHGLLEPMFAEAELTEGRVVMVEKPADLYPQLLQRTAFPRLHRFRRRSWLHFQSLASRPNRSVRAAPGADGRDG